MTKNALHNCKALQTILQIDRPVRLQPNLPYVYYILKREQCQSVVRYLFYMRHFMEILFLMNLNLMESTGIGLCTGDLAEKYQDLIALKCCA